MEPTDDPTEEVEVEVQAEYEDDFDDGLPGSEGAQWMMPVLIALLGVGAGYMAHMLTAEPEILSVTEYVEKMEELTAEEIELLCADEVDTERSALQEAQTRVEDLESQLASREAQVADLKAKARRNQEGAAAARERWQTMEAELAELKTQLAQAEAERDQALEDLQATVVALNQQIRETQKAKNEAARYKDLNTKHSWDSFLANAKIAVCGELWVSGRGRQKRCNEAVEEALGPDIKQQFENCVDTYQSTPLFLRSEADTLPAFATPVPSNRFTRNRWYIQFCDPTLPEGTEQDLESFQPAEEGTTRETMTNEEAPSWDDLDDIFDEDLDDLPD
ncbi:MAG: hypothetical protein VXW32_07285 [Myxococcota bacterium]|nr:hypothetical protein [Myxococcota bacterium]